MEKERRGHEEEQAYEQEQEHKYEQAHECEQAILKLFFVQNEAKPLKLSTLAVTFSAAESIINFYIFK